MALIAIMWMLALNLTKIKTKAIDALIIPPKKKKYKSGNRSKVMLFPIKTDVKAICNNNGILRCEASESIMVSTFPKVRNK